MTGRILAVVLAAGFCVPMAAQAQTFKVDKYDIKGEGGTDYIAAEAATGRVFVSRSTHVMVYFGTCATQGWFKRSVSTATTRSSR